MSAVAVLALADARRLLRSADVVGALSLDALKGTNTAFDPRIQAARPHPGQAVSARNLSRRLARSPIRDSHRDCGKVQAAYSLRCMPQVHGASRDALDYVARAIAVEMNAATDNPMVFAESGELLSGGNFHGQPVAIAADSYYHVYGADSTTAPALQLSRISPAGVQLCQQAFSGATMSRSTWITVDGADNAIQTGMVTDADGRPLGTVVAKYSLWRIASRNAGSSWSRKSG